MDIFNGSTDRKNHLYRNNGDGTFENITDEADIEAVFYGTRGVVALDANNDGFMDLYAVNWYNPDKKDTPEPNEFYLNDGDDDPFSASNPTNIGIEEEFTRAIIFGDMDSDGDGTADWEQSPGGLILDIELP